MEAELAGATKATEVAVAGRGNKGEKRRQYQQSWQRQQSRLEATVATRLEEVTKVTEAAVVAGLEEVIYVTEAAMAAEQIVAAEQEEATMVTLAEESEPTEAAKVVEAVG